MGVTTAAVAAITFDEVFDLFYSLKNSYRRRAQLVMNDSTVKLLRKLKDNNGQYTWQPSVALRLSSSLPLISTKTGVIWT